MTDDERLWFKIFPFALIGFLGFIIFEWIEYSRITGLGIWMNLIWVTATITYVRLWLKYRKEKTAGEVSDGAKDSEGEV